MQNVTTTLVLLVSLWLFAPPGKRGAAPSYEPPPPAPSASCWEPLTGDPGTSARWESGWIDLTKTATLHTGDKVRLTVGGSAKQMIVRFLEKGESADDPTGVEGGAITVPAGRLVEITLQGDHPNVKQISVHGGTNPFGLYSLGGGNGPATLQSVEVCHK